MDVRVLPRADGTIGVQAGDLMLLDGSQAKTLEVVTVGAGFGLQTTSGAAVDPRGGSLHALTDLTQNRLPAVRADLDAMAAALVSELNALHRSGYTGTGATNIDFFDPAGTTAATIQLSAAVLGSSDQIAAASVNAPGDGALATRIAGLASTALGALGGRSLREHFVSLASGVGIEVRSAAQDFEAQVVLVERADQARLAVSGVSVDEEMVTLISQQQAYQAAARLISIADEMVADLMRIL
jgi:flagellar hook-associated protein 1 FlgK